MESIEIDLKQMISPPVRVYRNVIIASIFINLFMLCLPLITMSVYQTVLPAGAMATLIALSFGVFMVITFDWLFNRYRMRMIMAIQTKSDKKIARQIYQRVANAALDGRVLNGSALMSTVRDFDQARSSLASGVVGIMIDLPFMFLFVLFLMAVNLYIGLVALVGVIIILASGYINMHEMLKYHGVVGKMSIARHKILMETIRDFVQARTSGWMKHLSKSHDDMAAKMALSSAHMNQSGQSSAILTKTLVQAVQTLTTLAGAWAVIEGSLSMAGLIGFSMLSSRTAAVAGQISASLPRWRMAKLALENVEQSMNMPQERLLSKDYIKDLAETGDLACEQMNFTYPEMPVPALQDIHFTLPAGKTVVIMGTSGSGKTTLLNMLMGLYPPSQGHVRYANIDLTYVDPTVYRERFNSISAEPLLFGDTLADWMTYDMPDGALEQVERILIDLGFGSLIKEHPKGIHRPLEGGGQGFSVGQKKIVALVRTLLKPSSLLIMDEPTESMDAETRKKIVELIRNRKGDRSLIIASHDNNILELADYVAIMGNGRLLIFDTIDVVSAKMGITKPARSATASPSPATSPKTT
jgi:ATP-binding cassette subfamily C protein LapB